MSRPAEPPQMPRRWVKPLRMWLAIGVLGVLPLIALLGELGDQARKSVLHIATAYAVLTLCFRLMGKRELNQLSLFGEMRKQGIDALDRVRFAVLEGDGSISFVRHAD